MSSITTWQDEFAKVSADDHSKVVAIASGEEVLTVRFDAGWGGVEGPQILIWTEDYVYFPVVYDGAEELCRAPRNPRPEPQAHVGGY